MDAGVLIIIVVVVLVILGLLALVLSQRQRTQRLQQRFGPEYSRTVARTGGQRSAETELASRERRHRELKIISLEPAAQARYREAWQTTQATFVDDPSTATREADELISRLMRDRGYPVDDFEQQADDISVEHPRVAENYRAAHALYRANEKGLAGTDDLREAFVRYRSLFAELLDVDGETRKEAPDERQQR